MKRINLNNALKQLEELKRVQGDKDAVVDASLMFMVGMAHTMI